MAEEGIGLMAIARQDTRGRQGLFLLIMILMCLMLICLGHIMEGFVPPPREGESDASGETVMAEPSRFPTKGAVVVRSQEPAQAEPKTASEAEATRSEEPVVLTVVYDNNPHDPRLKTAWGFACLVETPDGVVLFDTGGDGEILLANLETLGFDPRRIDAVVLSHIHADHVGGLEALLGSNDHLVVYIPRSFPEGFTRRVRDRARVVEVDGPMEIIDGVHTTGEMGSTIVEQSLIIETVRGLVVVTGCAHPGIVSIVRQAAAQGEIDLVIGGFHLGDRSREDVQAVIEELLNLGVRWVAPCHCTGVGATAEFEAAFGSGFIPCGVGTVITIGQ
jgi:7,8-dihydropterin-6-yl-methyl-4-(beta-D-ribofuranosyl)aminobenzene 5'-phosphate synthase